MPDKTVSLEVKHKCGCLRTYTVNGDHRTLGSLQAQLETETCKQSTCPARKRNQGLRAGIR